MGLKFDLKPRQIAIFLAAVALYFALQSIVSEYLLENVLRAGATDESLLISIIDLFSVNAEKTIPTWYATLLLFGAAALLALITIIKFRQKGPFKFHWLGLAAVFLYLSMDEGAAIHEIFSDPIQETLNPSGFLSFGWYILFAPLVAIFVLVYLRFLLQLPGKYRYLFILSGAIYVGGAVFIEAISANRWYLDGGLTFAYLAIATVEELMEMWGIILFIYTLLSYCMTFQYSFEFAPSTAESNTFTWPKRAMIGALLFIIGLNVALFSWAFSQRVEQVIVDPRTRPFYQTVSERYDGQGVVILGINEVISADNPAAPPFTSSLLTLFDDVMVVTLPSAGSSVAFAGYSLPFSEAALTEIMEQSGEEEFVILDIDEVRRIADR